MLQQACAFVLQANAGLADDELDELLFQVEALFSTRLSLHYDLTQMLTALIGPSTIADDCASAWIEHGCTACRRPLRAHQPLHQTRTMCAVSPATHT
jgi:hypothetical protein